MTTDHRVLCIENIDDDGVVTMTNQTGRFVHFSHVSALIRKSAAFSPVSTHVFTVTQGPEDLERLRNAYQPNRLNKPIPSKR